MIPMPVGELLPSTRPSRMVTLPDLHAEIESSGHELRDDARRCGAGAQRKTCVGVVCDVMTKQ